VEIKNTYKIEQNNINIMDFFFDEVSAKISFLLILINIV